MSQAAAFFEEVYRLFQQAREQAGFVDHQIQIGPVCVQQRFAGDGLAGKMHTAIEHLKVEWDDDAAVDLEVCFWDSDTTGITMPPPPWGEHDYGPKGEIIGFNDDRYRVIYSLGADSLQMYDSVRKIGIYWVPAPARLPDWEESFPMRTILHWWTEGKPYQLIHAGAIGTGEAGVLITGRSGSGKSTSTLSCLEGGLDYAGDDYVMVQMLPGKQPHVFSLYNTTKLINDNLDARFPQLAEWVHNKHRIEGEKALIYLHKKCPQQMSKGFPLVAVFEPNFSGTDQAKIHRVGGARVLRAMAPSTVFHLPGKSHEAFAFMTALIKQLPCYVMETGPALQQIPEVLSALVGELTAQSLEPESAAD